MSVPEHVVAEVEQARKSWWLFLLMGIVMVIAGLVAIFTPLASGLVITRVLGVVLLIAAVARLVKSIRTRTGAGSIVLGLIVAALYVIAGLWLLSFPLMGMVMLTVVLGVLYAVTGLFHIAEALDRVGKVHWGWDLVGGILNLVLGILILAWMPTSAIWILGLFVGIDLLFVGATLISLSLAAHSHTAGMRLAGQR